jgi:hypothetical protein
MAARTFRFQGREYDYFSHPYNSAGTNERTVEVPLARDWLARHEGPALEVGNVLSHYGSVSHPIVDRYEPAEGVLNVDIEAYRPEAPFGLILALSTLEHIGWDEGERREPEKLPRVLRHLLEALLRPGGAFLATVPLGHNPHLDALVRERRTGTELAFLRRVNAENDWEEISEREVGEPRYGYPFNNGNTLAILFREAGPTPD